MNNIIQYKQHKLLHGDITKGSIDLLMDNEKFDILYSDPPWGIGNLKFWNTMNAKMNNLNKSEVNWEYFIKCFCDIINNYSKSDSIVIIEMGLRFSDYFRNVIEQNTGFMMQQIFNTLYRGGHKLLPLHIMYFANTNTFTFDESVITNTFGDKCTDSIINQCAFDGAVVLDPCCGFGRTFRMANKYNMIFRGNEINKARLNKAIKYGEKCYEQIK